MNAIHRSYLAERFFLELALAAATVLTIIVSL